MVDILTEEQLNELRVHLLTRGEIPMKFAYLGKGTYNWAEIFEERMKKR